MNTGDRWKFVCTGSPCEGEIWEAVNPDRAVLIRAGLRGDPCPLGHYLGMNSSVTVDLFPENWEPIDEFKNWARRVRKDHGIETSSAV